MKKNSKNPIQKKNKKQKTAKVSDILFLIFKIFSDNMIKRLANFNPNLPITLKIFSLDKIC